MEWLSIVLTGIVGLATAWFNYNQHTKNKQTDARIEAEKEDRIAAMKVREEAHSKEIAELTEITAHLHGDMWSLLIESEASRVYIIQPHPPFNSLYLSIKFEARKKGITAMETFFHNVAIETVQSFADDLSKREWMMYGDIEKECRNEVAKAILLHGGTTAAYIRRLHNTDGKWVGNLVVEYVGGKTNNIAKLKGDMYKVALSIQDTLPPILN